MLQKELKVLFNPPKLVVPTYLTLYATSMFLMLKEKK